MSEWKLTTLGDLGRWRTGKTPRSAEPANWGEGVEFVTPGDLGSGGELGSVARTISKTGVSGSVLFSAPSVLLGCIGTIGKVNWSRRPVASNQQINGLEVNQEIADAQFVSWLLASAGMQEKLWAESSGTTVAIVNRTKLERIVVSLPPLDEQKRIVAKLDQIRREVGRLSDNVAEQMETVKSLRGAALADRLQGENVLQGNVAAGWPVAVLTDHVEVQPPNGKVKRSDFLARGTYPVVSQEVGSINGWWDGPAEVTPVDRPVVLFGDHTRILKYIDHDFVVGADGVKILRPRSSLDPRFLFHLLTANPPRHLGYARHFRLMKELKFRLPPLEEQQSIAAELDGLGVQFDEIESRLAEQETLLSSFQSAAFSTVLAGGP